MAEVVVGAEVEAGVVFVGVDEVAAEVEAEEPQEPVLVAVGEEQLEERWPEGKALVAVAFH